MKNIILILFLVLSVSCQQDKIVHSQSFEEDVVDFAIKQKNNRPIEVKDLYESLADKIPDDSDEKSVFVRILKKKGFKITDWGRGNFTHGPRVIIYDLAKENCECTVAKYYYSTQESAYLRTEAISCK
ncbi:hypothetical protein NAT51_19075 [Flavobacterium amniphilum]|uniref:hypothetical protein n=1 Tax=Flavobacterium amniphilum TaxID=1834035 RepID=UPI00202A62BE|nr:hypothetical protein [Flavobacterium amniphilum]MCL9807633.1 hypothetical protein [Flavobacterium amniphilum]